MTHRLAVLLAVLALVAAACNGGDGDTGTGETDTGGTDTGGTETDTGTGDTGTGTEGAAAGGELSVWIMQPGSEELEQIVNDDVAEFEEETGATVDLQFVPWANAHDQFVTAIGGGQVPDVAEMGTTWTPEFAELGGLAPLPGATEADYVEALVESATVEGEVYGAPWYAGARGLIYRADVFEELGLEPPETWDQLIEAGERIDAETDLYPFGVIGNYVHLYLPMIWNWGGTIAEESDGQWTATIGSPEAQEAWSLYGELFRERGWSPEGALQWNSADLRNAFATGDFAMMIGGGWDFAAIENDAPDLEIAATLAPEGPGGNRDAFAGGSHLVMFEGSQNPDLAQQFIDFMLEADRVSEFATAVGFLPGTESGIEASGILEDEAMAPFGEQLRDHSRSYPATGAWGTLEGEGVFVDAIQQVMTGDLTAEEALEQVQQQMEAELQ